MNSSWIDDVVSAGTNALAAAFGVLALSGVAVTATTTTTLALNVAAAGYAVWSLARG